MTPRNGTPHYSLFILLGAAVTFALFLVVLHFNAGGRLDAESIAKVQALQTVDHMSFELALASQKEWSAVMAETDEDSRAFADQARSAAASVEEQGRELKTAMAPYFTGKDKDLLEQLAKAFAAYGQVDADLLDLAVQHTNMKAYSLAFGPSDRALQDMLDALGGLTGPTAMGPDNPVPAEAVRLAYQAEVGALRIQTLLAPHIAEALDEKMDQIEIWMASEDKSVREALDGLGELAKLAGQADDKADQADMGPQTGLGSRWDVRSIASARAAYEKFSAIRTDILRLSRQNTNVRSVAMAMDRKRNLDAQCQELLESVRQAIARSMPGEMVKTKGALFSN